MRNVNLLVAAVAMALGGFTFGSGPASAVPFAPVAAPSVDTSIVPAQVRRTVVTRTVVRRPTRVVQRGFVALPTPTVVVPRVVVGRPRGVVTSRTVVRRVVR